ncbi:hypothetical protein ASG89_22310 [Paenibacillus sp. Soil766]|uniref:response regulator transcription factor n=1 Tax=Paenibacillus sp. Soil766 TaxID=1736404 RepID=UPI000709D019|nr:response regulator [Paenibacillus sp. Soil766]KRF04123.1 hypothetical protein ASG89_22310 [Paenibacillus sp. Soil766]
MYRLFIVDDEQLVVETLSTMINWNDYGVQIVGTAYNGKQALNQIIQTEPDIVLTDIRMPGLNGLELIRAVKEHGIKAEFIIESGYSEFEYAKEAIELEAVDYLIKPVELNEVANTVKRAIDRLERKFEKNVIRPKRRIAEALDRAVLTDLVVHGKAPSFDHKPFEQYTQYSAIVISSATTHWLERLKADGITDSILDFFSSKGITVDLLYEKQKIILLCMVSLDDPDQLREILKLAASKFSYGITPDCLSLVFGTGTIVWDIMDAHKSYLAADGACQMGLFFNIAVIDGNRWLELSYVSEQFASEWLEVIIPYSRKFEEMLNLWTDKGSSGLITPFIIKKTAVQWTNWMLNKIEEDYSVKIEKVIGDRSTLLDNMLQASSWSSLKKECHELLKSVQFFLNVTKTTLKEKLVQEIKTYLEAHYCENIQLDQLAEHVDLSASYISNLYSKSTGQTILEYITSLRIQKSKQLLRESSLKISRISTSVGYDNQRYFGHVFKKHVGISPGQYREDHMIQQ